MSRLSPLPLLVAVALLLFGVWMHWAVLWPGNVGWLLDGQDRGQSAIGLAAYLRAGTWPSLREPLLMAPEGLSLLFTDSIPLLGLGLGPAARMLPGTLQFLGPWLLACMLLQVSFAWLLVRPHAPDRPTALLATVLLAAMPALFNRYGHASLCAQWLILGALWVYRDPVRSEDGRWWTAALGVAALVHSYLLLMVASFWAGTLLRLLVRRRWRRFVPVLLPPAAVAIAVMAWHGALAGGYASTGTYGIFPLALDAWWNPANPSFSALLPSSPQNHGQGFEGFTYLGVGLLALVVLGVARRMLGGAPARLKDRPDVPLGWLVPGFAVLLLVAIGPQPLWRGEPLWTAHLPGRVVDLLDPVRAAGRLVWPVSYAIAYAAVVAALRRPGATVLLGAALALQIVDLAPMLAAVRATSARADDPRPYGRTRDPRWRRLIAEAGSVEIEPADPSRDLQLMEEVAWRAVDACRPIRFFYASRERRDTRVRVDADTRAFRAGRLDPTRLYILLDGRAPPGLADRVERLDGVALIAPTRRAAPPACATASSSSPRSAS